MSNNISVENVGCTREECRVVISKMTEMFDKFKQMQTCIEQLKEGDESFSKYVDESQLHYLMCDLMHNIELFQGIEKIAGDMWQELTIAYSEIGGN